MTDVTDPKNIQHDPNATTVFFSYSRADQAKALPIIQAIRDAGYRVWWDGMLEVGETFLETTEQALETAKAVVVLWSATSTSSHWVRDEATSGRIRNRLVPLSLDGSQPPLGFRQVQVIDMKNWSGRPDGPAMLQIKRVLAHYHDTSEAIIPSASTASVTSDLPATEILARSANSPSRRKVLWGGVGAAAIFVGTGFAAKSFLAGNLPVINSLAVMPFRNLSRDPDMDYLASGLASDLRTNLSRNDVLKVAARLSSEAIAKEGLGAEEISKRLGVGLIIEGQIEKIGSILRVTTELIDGKSGFTTDVKVFENSNENVIGFRDEISRAISNILTLQMSNDFFESKSGATQNAAAFNEYLKGMDVFLSSRGVTGTETALNHIDAALRFDPKFGSAHSARARMLLFLGGTASDAQLAANYFMQSTASARKAVDLSPELAEAHSTLGNVLLSANLDVKGARAPYVKARELGAGDADILGRYASFMAVTGQNALAQSSIRYAMELDPLNLTMRRTSGLINYSARRFSEAAADYQYIIDRNPEFWGANARLGLAQLFSGQVEQGLASCEAERNDMERLPCEAIARYRIDDQDGAQSAFDELVETYGNSGAYQQAQVLAQWGNYEKALEKLEFAVEIGDSGLTYVYTDPSFNTIKDLPRFKAILETIGFL